MDKKTRYHNVLDFLDEISDPKISVHTALNKSQEEIIIDLFQEWSDQATELYIELTS